MPQSLVQVYVHIVFSTKDRQPFLNEPTLRGQLHAYLAGICKKQESPALIVGGVADHVHLLVRLAKVGAISDLIRDLKRNSTIWLKEAEPTKSDFHWQQGYGAFSISPGHLDALTRYITNQEEHHRTISFKEELRRLCRKYGVELDEKYVWD